jgi:hypothetical protein
MESRDKNQPRRYNPAELGIGIFVAAAAAVLAVKGAALILENRRKSRINKGDFLQSTTHTVPPSFGRQPFDALRQVGWKPSGDAGLHTGSKWNKPYS